MDSWRMKDNRTKVRYSYTGNEELMKRVKVYAVMTNQRINQVIDKALERYLEQEEEKASKTL